MSSTNRPRALTVLHVYGYSAPMILALVIVAWAAPAVTTPSTTVTATLVVTAAWATAALGIALASWWVAHRHGAGIWEFVAFTPRSAHAHSPAREALLDTVLVSSGAMAVFIGMNSVTVMDAGTSSGPTPLGLATAITTAVLSDLVLLGVVGVLVRAASLGVHDLMILTVLGRVWIADGSPIAWAAAAVGGVVVAWMYWRTRQLAPVIVGHIIATIVITPPLLA